MQNKTIPYRTSKRPHHLFLFIIVIIITITALFPSVLLANADKIFKENNKAVVVVVAFDDKNKPISQGSGFIVRPDGAIVTNYHVISNAKGIAVKAGDKVIEVEGFIYMDKENDLVILKAKAKNLPFVKIGDINKANIGEKVYVISSPEGLENTISDGILSGIRDITSDKKILQITAPISSGSSGGPVFNKNSEVIGIATFLIKEAQNLNFAMPVNLIKENIGSKKITALKDAGIEEYEKSAEYWFNIGFAYSKGGMNREAIEAYKQGIRIKPDYAEAHNDLGVAYNNLGMYREAIEACKQAIRIKPDLAEPHYNLGLAYNNLGMYREAIEACKQAIRIKPDLAEAHNNLGFVYAQLGMYKEAIEACKQAIRIKPDYAEPHYNLGLIYAHRLGMYKEAVAIFKEAIRIKPDYAKAHNNLGFVYAQLGMYKEAIEACKQAIRIKPDYADAHLVLGITYLMLGDKGSALEEYKILKELDKKKADELFNAIYK